MQQFSSEQHNWDASSTAHDINHPICLFGNRKEVIEKV